MATVYILYSPSIDRYYVGSCLNLEQRIEEHNQSLYESAYTKRATDWRLYYSEANLGYDQARKIERQIKLMKSRKYFKNLRKHPGIMEKLKEKYS